MTALLITVVIVLLSFNGYQYMSSRKLRSDIRYISDKLEQITGDSIAERSC